MKSYELRRLLLLLFLVQWSQVNGLCSLDKPTTAECHDLEDARYIDTYQLHVLRAPSWSKTLTPGNFRNLTSLRHLDLSGGMIERIESGSFAKLSSLQSLNLADNRITQLDAGAFDGLKHLHSLVLRSNDIRHLPAALMTLKSLRMLDISDNLLNCNCASMKLRDALLARGVKISKKTQCFEPISIRFASILKPDTKITCLFEKQDLEMQADQAIEGSTEGSGEADADDVLGDNDKDYIEKELNQLGNGDNEETTSTLPTSSEETSQSSTISSTSIEAVSTEVVSSTTTGSKDDITFEDNEDSSKKDITTEISTGAETTESEESKQVEGVNDDLIIPVLVTKEPSKKVSTSTTQKITDELIVPDEGSGETDDDGSGSEGSGLIVQMPAIDFNETGEIDNDDTIGSSTTTTTTTTEASWWDILNNFNPFASSETTAAPRTTEASTEDDLQEEQFIKITTKTPTNAVNEIAIPKTSDESLPKLNPKSVETNDIREPPTDETNGSNTLDPAFSQESKKGTGSYAILATLLAILVVLIAFAAYKGDVCRKKRKRGDVERGTEMKDMQRSLLEQNSAQPKVQVSNGNTLENVPLMSGTAPPEEPKDNQRSYDITPSVVTNGSSRVNGTSPDVNDPIKPPRKLANQEIEAPLNGLNPPMDAIDAPIRTSLNNGSNEMLNNGDYNERPPLSPGAQRVKITLQENPDSVPKTPILITRLKGSENLVKAP